jgi:beta-N-acetylhexosaminidase
MSPRHSLLLPCLLLAACGGAPAVAPGGAAPGAVTVAAPAADRQAAEAWVESTLRGLTLREKVAQLTAPWVSGEYLAIDSDEYDRLRRWVVDEKVGGIIMSIGAPLQVAAKLNMLQQLADVPMLISADMEHGPGQRLYGGTVMPWGIRIGSGTIFPPLMAFGATGDERLAYELGRITALEARAAGIHMTYSPVVDVNNNPSNPIINTRSYGEDPALVSRMAAAHIRGLQEHGMLATAKHFPGHGDTGVDSHIDLPFIAVDAERAHRVELPPFRAAIAAGVAAVMTAHIAFPALTGDSVPATLNRKLATELLKEELGFQGLVVTDALDMGAIVKHYGRQQAGVMALQAGADVLLMPPDITELIEGVVAAVARGEVTEERIDYSVRRVLRIKAGLGLHRQRTVDLDHFPHVVGTRAHGAVARQVAERAITAVRDRGGLLPLTPEKGRRILSIVYTDDFDPVAGRIFQQLLAEGDRPVRLEPLDRHATPARLAELRAAADSADVVLVSPFVRVMAWKGDVHIAAPVATFIRDVAARRPTVVVAFGNPYLLTQFPEVGTYVVAWGHQEVVERAAAGALLGRTAIGGRLPIAIPPLYPVGAGLDVPAVATAARAP